MGKILKLLNKSNDKVELTLELSQKEVIFLRGNLDKMHLFSEDNLNVDSRLVNRGKDESTKYFLIPKEFKNEVNSSKEVLCTKIETKTKHLFVYAINKF